MKVEVMYLRFVRVVDVIYVVGVVEKCFVVRCVGRCLFVVGVLCEVS